MCLPPEVRWCCAALRQLLWQLLWQLGMSCAISASDMTRVHWMTLGVVVVMARLMRHLDGCKLCFPACRSTCEVALRYVQCSLQSFCQLSGAVAKLIAF